MNACHWNCVIIVRGLQKRLIDHVRKILTQTRHSNDAYYVKIFKFGHSSRNIDDWFLVYLDCSNCAFIKNALQA